MRTHTARDAIASSSLLVLGGVLAAWTWLSWPDLLVDFGREAYVAWRLGEADTLYRDVAYLNGPVSPYRNALVMRATGLGIRALFMSNALVLVALVVLIQMRLAAVSDRASAWAANARFRSTCMQSWSGAAHRCCGRGRRSRERWRPASPIARSQPHRSKIIEIARFASPPGSSRALIAACRDTCALPAERRDLATSPIAV
jgi:hypothetical protein